MTIDEDELRRKLNANNPGNILGLYVLDAAGNPVEEPDVLKWGEWLHNSYETRERWIAKTEAAPGAHVSTVFLGVDHSHGGIFGDTTPILFETMCFDDDMHSLPVYGGDDNEESLFGRYATRAEALEGHEAIVVELRLKLSAKVC